MRIETKTFLGVVTFQMEQERSRTFNSYFTKKNLRDIFDDRIASKDNAGLDGIHAHDFEKVCEGAIAVIQKKVKAGTFNFTPYAEIQISKGRGKLPRILALPTVRDQISLSSLKDFLHDYFPDAVNHKLPNSYIFELNEEIRKITSRKKKYGFIKVDISGFYDNIDREKLMNLVRKKVNKPQALKLIYQAISNPIVPRNSKRNQRFHYHNPKGIPQGLSISNILANIYMTKFDKIIKSATPYCARYVDDILILCQNNEMHNILEKLHFEISKLGLKLNEEKTKIGILDKNSFDFLGYKLKANQKVSVRDSSVHRKITSLAAKISSADHKQGEFRKLHPNIDKKTYRRVLVEDINEQITGAISDSKRYGWLFYFLQINDIALLHRLDRIVEKLCKRCGTFSKKKPKKIKSFVKAFREIHQMRQNKTSSYIPHYDDLKWREKMKFLLERGVVEDKKHQKKEINRLFKIEVQKRMKKLRRDITDIS